MQFSSKLDDVDENSDLSAIILSIVACARFNNNPQTNLAVYVRAYAVRKICLC